MGIRFNCPNGHKLNVKDVLAGKRAICPNCGAKVIVPLANEPAGEGSLTEESARIATPLMMIPVQEPAPPALPVGLTAIQFAEPAKVAPLIGVGTSTPGSLSSANAFVLQRRKHRQKQIKLAMILFATALVLGIVLIWVLTRGSGEEDATKAASFHAIADKVAANA